MRAPTPAVNQGNQYPIAFESVGNSFQLPGNALGLYNKATRLLGAAALTLATAGCGSASLSPVSQASVGNPGIGVQSLNGSRGDPVLSAPAVLGGHLILAPLHRRSGHGYLPSEKLKKNVIYVVSAGT